MLAEAFLVRIEIVTATVESMVYQFMLKNSYVRSEFDSCVYFKELKDGECVYLLLHVDDILIASKNMRHI